MKDRKLIKTMIDHGHKLAKLDRDIAALQAMHVKLVDEGHSEESFLYEDTALYLVDERYALLEEIRTLTKRK